MQQSYQHIIQKWTNHQSFNEKIITLFEKVRDIPYGTIDSRNPFEVFNKNMGTCSGKHALLKGLYIELGLEVKDFIVMHTFNNLAIEYPRNLKKLLAQSTVLDPHNFLKIKRNNEWITVDVTWDQPLKKLGFPMNENWDGNSNLNILVAAENEIFQTNDVVNFKRELLEDFTTSAQKEREIFLKLFSNWLSTQR